MTVDGINGAYGTYGVGGADQNAILQDELESGIFNSFSQCQSPQDVMSTAQQLMNYLPELQQMGIPTDGLDSFIQEVSGLALQQVQAQGAQQGNDPSQGGAVDPTSANFDPTTAPMSANYIPPDEGWC
jgi:hypothetical protein